MLDLSSRRASGVRCVFIRIDEESFVESILASTPRLAWLIHFPSQSDLTSSSARCWQLLEKRLYRGWSDMNFEATIDGQFCCLR